MRQVEELSTNSTLTRVSTSSSVNSTVSTSTVIPTNAGGYGMPLEHLCRLISSYPSLQDAEIVASACYTKRITSIVGIAVLHRYLVLELRREGKKTIWVRLDRARSKASESRPFLRALGQTRANDVVSATQSRCDIGHGATDVIEFLMKGSTSCQEGGPNTRRATGKPTDLCPSTDIGNTFSPP